MWFGNGTMTEKNLRLYSFLTYAGALPFALVFFAHLLGITEIYIIGASLDAVAVYALAILSFVAGSQWGLYKTGDHEKLPNMFIYSNLVTVTGFIGYLILPAAAYLVIAAILFVVLLWFEKDFYRVGVTSLHYLKIRIIVTGLVVLSLLSTSFVSLL